ncbi:MAG: hypothetical protein EXR58_05370 [Chloroflexi bacterium]|nr:hypothetical protein [Chloroflexota bacterium]
MPYVYLRELWEPAVRRLVQRSERFAEEAAADLEAQKAWTHERVLEERAVFHQIRVNTIVPDKIGPGQIVRPRNINVPSLEAISASLREMLILVCFPIWDSETHDI